MIPQVQQGHSDGAQRRLRVLVFSGCYLPGFRAGGPIRSLANLVDGLGARIDFRVITLDRDVGSDRPYKGIRMGEWQDVNGTRVLYLSRSAATILRLVREAAAWSPDLIYLNGFFEPVFTLRVLFARRWGRLVDVPVLLAPRGDCSPGALKQKSFKKRIFIRVATWLELHRGVEWHASSPLEVKDIEASAPFARRSSIHVASAVTRVPAGTRAWTRPPGDLRICFLARISPMKNLDFALRALARVRAPVEFTIYGPCEVASYWKLCEALMAALPPNVRARYAGEVHPFDVSSAMAAHDLFFLPSLGESFGHVIHEALSAGLAVLTSDRTPWADLESHGVGWSLPLEPAERFSEVIQLASVQLVSDTGLRQRAAEYAQARSSQSNAGRATYELFESLSGRR